MVDKLSAVSIGTVRMYNRFVTQNALDYCACKS